MKQVLNNLNKIQKNLTTKRHITIGYDEQVAHYGKYHITGTVNMPARDFMFFPIEHELTKIKINVFNRLKKINFLNTSIETSFTDIGSYFKDTISFAFNTNGFGQWAPLASSTLKKKKNPSLILREEYKLINSIFIKIS